MAGYSAPLENNARDIALEVNIPMSHMDHPDVNSGGRLKNPVAAQKEMASQNDREIYDCLLNKCVLTKFPSSSSPWSKDVGDVKACGASSRGKTVRWRDRRS